MLEISRLSKKATQSIKVGDQQIIEKFDQHVERGGFEANLDQIVKSDMKDVQKA